jgi:acetolactate synthase I/II/III large subunit
MRYNGAEIIIKSLERQGIEIVTGIPGGSNLPLYNALYKSQIRHILARHEQGAGFIAHGMARSTGKPAVCFATSGPGVTNLLTAIADAKLDSVPLIAVTGQVPTSLIGTDAFQEVDTYSLTIPITKHNFFARSAAELPSIMAEAFDLATAGRPGPVVVDVPKDVQLDEVEVAEWPHVSRGGNHSSVDISAVRRAAQMVNQARNPVIYGGGGIMVSGAHEAMYELSKKNTVPAALTLMGLGCFPPEDPLYLGMLGMHGALSTNMILEEADLLLALGVRFDDRAIGNVKHFCPKASIIHVDIDDAEIDKIRRVDLLIRGDLGTILKTLVPLVEHSQRRDWVSRIAELKSLYPSTGYDGEDGLHPINILKAVSAAVPKDAIVTTDVGQHQMWVAQSYPFRHPRSLLTSGGLGTMGFGLPAAIGAAIANPGRQIICVSGDGSLQMNIQEMATLAELNLPVVVVLFNNGHLGLVRQQQEMFYEKNYIASKFACRLDFAAIGREFGIRGYRVNEASSLHRALSEALSCPGPCIIDISVDERQNVLPIVPPGAANRDMIGGGTHELHSC